MDARLIIGFGTAWQRFSTPIVSLTNIQGRRSIMAGWDEGNP